WSKKMLTLTCTSCACATVTLKGVAAGTIGAAARIAIAARPPSSWDFFIPLSLFLFTTTRHAEPMRTRAVPASGRAKSAGERVDLPQRGEEPSPEQHHGDGADASHGDRGHRPDQPADDAGAKLADLIRCADEERVHRVHPP